MSGPEVLGVVVVVAIILGLIAWVFGEVCDLLIYWWQKR